MAKTRAIVKRRKAIRNIRKITRTMELIATARFKKAMDRAVQASAYTRKVGELVADLSHSASAGSHPLLADRPNPQRSILLVLTSNRGLCGGYNGNIVRLAGRVLAEQPVPHMEMEISGKRGINYFRFRGVVPTRTYLKFEDKPTFDEVDELASRYLKAYLNHDIDRLDVVYTRFISMGRQEATVATLLPLGKLETPVEATTPAAGMAAKLAAGHTATKKAGEVQYDFYPSAEDILNELVPTSFKAQLFKCFLDAAVSEQIARMMAMKGATENANALAKDLTLRYNRARQSQITSELAEIIGTAEALK